MTEQEIHEAFFRAIAERGISNKIKQSRSRVSHWKNGDTPPLGIMVEVLLKLNRIKITLNEQENEH